MRRGFSLFVAALLLTLSLQGSAQSPHLAHAYDGYDEHEAQDSLEARTAAEKRIHWRDPNAAAGRLHVKLLGFNDFHGQISQGRTVGGRPVGGAAVLAAYVKAATRGLEDRSLIVHAGDHVGASPPASALLQDEPSIQFLNLLANAHCSYERRSDPRCNLVGTPGNHELDEGKDEMLRLLHGGNHANGPFLQDPYRGTRFPYVCANIVDSVSGRPILPPYVIKRVRGVPIAFIGAVLKDTPTIVTPTGVAGLRFLDEAQAINQYIPELKARQVRAIVVLIHEGGQQALYAGGTRTDASVNGRIAQIAANLHDEIDVVVSGHTHAFTNALIKNKNGKEILVTQAFSTGTAYADIDLEIDLVTRDVAAKSAAVITTFADAGPGLAPDPEVAQLVAQAEAKVAPLVTRVIAVAAMALTRAQNPAGESALGNLIADAQRSLMDADFAFMNPGGIRADLDAGEITWGALFTVQPFGNTLVKMTLTGQQIYGLLNQQWINQPFPRLLQISGLTYTWDNDRPAGDRVVDVRKNGISIDVGASFTVAVNSFLAAGGDGFTVLAQGTERVGGPMDLDALIAYLPGLLQPLTAAIEGRIQRLH